MASWISSPSLSTFYSLQSITSYHSLTPNGLDAPLNNAACNDRFPLDLRTWLLNQSYKSNQLDTQTIHIKHAHDNEQSLQHAWKYHERQLKECTFNKNKPFIAHMEEWSAEMSNDGGMPFEKAMLAGAAAGVVEHLAMYPVDTLKTRMQVVQEKNVYTGLYKTAQKIVKEEGVKKLYRGFSAIVAAAVPSHAVHYAAYEIFREWFGGNRKGYHPFANGAAAGLATMAHDFIVTPLDVVKQRLQVAGSPYKSVSHCVARVFVEEGMKGFFASYPTTLLMNVPFVAVHFGTYETLKRLFTSDNVEHGPIQELLAGGLAGGMAGLVSTPLDVVKTRIQTQSLNSISSVAAHSCNSCSPVAMLQIVRNQDNTRRQVIGAVEIIKRIYQTEGMIGFTRGATARILYFMPSAAICWTTYETFKRVLKEAW